MRHFAALVLVILASLHANPQVSVNAGVQAKGSTNHENRSDGETQERPPAPAPDSVDSSQTRKSTPDQDKRNGQRGSDDRAYRVNIESQPTSGWTIAYVIITAVLGLLGAGTLWVLIYQTTTLGKQVRLQERGQRQWVNTSDWKVIAGVRLSDERPVLTISCEISNVTQAPIALILVNLNCEDYEGIGEGSEAFPANTLLLPNNPIRHSCSVLLTKEEHAVFTNVGVLLSIGGVIHYTDALDDTWLQGFRLTLAASPTGTFHKSYFHTIHKVQRTQIVQATPSRWRKALDWYVARIEAMKNGESEND